LKVLLKFYSANQAKPKLMVVAGWPLAGKPGYVREF